MMFLSKIDPHRFLDCEQWRKDFGGEGGVDNLVRTFDYKEKPEVTKYYPQYYHKTDKVCVGICFVIVNSQKIGWSSRIH